MKGRTRAETRAFEQQQLSTLSDEAVNTPLPPSEISMGLLAQAGEEVLLSMLDAKRVLKGKPMIRPTLKETGEQGRGGEESTRQGGGEESYSPKMDTGGEGRVESGWSVGPSQRGIPLGLVTRLATRHDLDSALHEMEPPLLRPDMPRCHAKDLRVPQTYKEARDGEHGEQFMDAAKREVFGLLEAEAFKVVGP